MLSAWIGYAGTIALIVLQFAVRVPFATKANATKVAETRRGALEVVLLTLVMVGYLVMPLLAIATPVLDAASYPLHAVAFGAGIVVGVMGLWLCWRSHADLGRNWSVTLKLKERHELVVHGIYQRVRHPMYSGLFLTAIAQALLLPNWIAGPAYLVAFGLMFALRIGPEERMMRDRFGDEYVAYASRTKRLVPGVY